MFFRSHFCQSKTSAAGGGVGVVVTPTVGVGLLGVGVLLTPVSPAEIVRSVETCDEVSIWSGDCHDAL